MQTAYNLHFDANEPIKYYIYNHDIVHASNIYMGCFETTSRKCLKLSSLGTQLSLTNCRTGGCRTSNFSNRINQIRPTALEMGVAISFVLLDFIIVYGVV